MIFNNIACQAINPIFAGTRCALVGESGHGKSTVISLLQRFYDPIEGEVMVDDVDIRRLQIPWVRAITCIVSQDPVIWSATVRENIQFGKLDATDEEIVEAARKSNSMDFIMKLPEQFDTLVGARGLQLSGGQKQRIAIARAILRNPKIVLLDEATSALDPESERDVNAAIQKFIQGRTTIAIAHRLFTIAEYDKIAAIYRGRILEEGTHDELLKIDRYYSYLIKTQR